MLTMKYSLEVVPEKIVALNTGLPLTILSNKYLPSPSGNLHKEVEEKAKREMSYGKGKKFIKHQTHPETVARVASAEQERPYPDLHKHSVLSVVLAPSGQAVHSVWPAKGCTEAPGQTGQPKASLIAPSEPAPFVPGGHFRHVRSVAVEYSAFLHCSQPFPGQPTATPWSCRLSGSASKSSTVFRMLKVVIW